MTEVPWLDDEEQRAWRAVMTMQDDLAEFLDRQMRNRDGLSKADYEVLVHLSEAPGGRLRSFRLGELLRWEKSRLSQHLGRMENRGLVIRERSLADQRGADVTISRRGTDLITAAAPRHVADVRAAFFDHLTAAELQTITTIAAKVKEGLAKLQP
ncbi:MarR family transcriptional regulator [Winogradskya consettensis]|uniref:MarR family transcriptional regulator n=1 Tax=Winogradskya consettensis TaxID=113560 RepID=A0A919SG50_9ACTN|nr:MarR family winged helix-turn-helix transcriptional regulator [Actinoplanes consettensis]GIM71044.1 MarR family transcriptional regulator [Actinoplanes consettensis]